MADLRPSLVPIPDPTVLTTAALKQAIDNLQDLFESKLSCAKELLEEKITNNYLMDQKRHRETREWLQELRAHRLESKEDRSKALDIALQSQKELFNQQRQCSEEEMKKMEHSFTKQIESMDSIFRDAREALSERIYALKEQVDKGRGGQEVKIERSHFHGWMIPLVCIGAIAFFNLIINVLQLLK